ncbi:MAG: hypothetical protein GWN16_08820, partial [Calditrichae bacterium]|nr:hypothetical protein [Calditrichia bacterium]
MQDITAVRDSLNMMEQQLANLSDQKDSLAQQEKYVSKTKKQAEETVRTGVKEIDLTLDELEKEKLAEQKKIPL